MARKPSRGRQRIAIERIEEDKARQVTFSKRRAGVFKKASELSILCGAESAIVIFTPTGRACSFGHPSVETVTDRYLGLNRNPEQALADAHCEARVRELNREYNELIDQLEAASKYNVELLEMQKAPENQSLFSAPIESLSLDQLQQLDSSMANIKTMLFNRLNEMQLTNSTSVPSYMPADQMNSMYPMTSMSTFGVSNPMNSINPMTQMGTIGGSNPFEPQSSMRNAFMFPPPPPFGPQPNTDNASIFPPPFQPHPNTTGKVPMFPPFQPHQPSSSSYASMAPPFQPQQPSSSSYASMAPPFQPQQPSSSSYAYMAPPFQPQQPSTSSNPSMAPHGHGHGYGFGGSGPN